MSNNEMTPEQKAALAAQNDHQAAVSYQFLQRHPYWKQCKRNADLMGKFLETYQLSVTLENLERGFDELEDQFIYLTEDERKSITAAILEKEEKQAPKYPWGGKLTPFSLSKISAKDYKTYLAKPEFRKQLNELGIKA